MSMGEKEVISEKLEFSAILLGFIFQGITFVALHWQE